MHTGASFALIGWMLLAGCATTAASPASARGTVLTGPARPYATQCVISVMRAGALSGWPRAEEVDRNTLRFTVHNGPTSVMVGEQADEPTQRDRVTVSEVGNELRITIVGSDRNGRTVSPLPRTIEMAQTLLGSCSPR
jgi:hypothetical protein